MNVSITFDAYGKLEFEMTSDQVTRMLTSAFGDTEKGSKVISDTKQLIGETDKKPQKVTLVRDKVATSRVTRMFGDSWRTPKAEVAPVAVPVPAPTQPMTSYHTYEEGIRGFLLIDCPSCGNRKGFCVKQPIKSSFCDCGNEIPLDDLVQAEIKCKCGKSFRYKTNIKEKFISYSCLNCGSPVDLEYNARRNKYITIGGGDR